MNELIWTLFVMAFGACIGWSVRDYLAEKTTKQSHTEHMGLYSDPDMTHWFKERLRETDPRLCRMPLRDYAAFRAAHPEHKPPLHSASF